MTRRGSYLHDGSAATLLDVVSAYASAVSDDPKRSERVRPLSLERGDEFALVEFLESLSGAERPGLAPHAWARRATETELAFVDAFGIPLTDVEVSVQAAGDRLPGWTATDDAPETLRAVQRPMADAPDPTPRLTTVRLDAPVVRATLPAE